ncbi:MAG: ribonuclease III domain-containing protein [Eubacteriales bacterium]|nr:ribonuclease III domain-containing protein [Eubacteriales bacterium]
MDRLELINQGFGVGAVEADELNGLTLAYIGDAVYELCVRLYMSTHGSRQVNRLHKHVTAAVNAAAQSELYHLIEPMLTPEEMLIFKRGRNSKTVTAAKNQKITDYRRATGVEALVGWLYLKDRTARIMELLSYGLPRLQENQADPEETMS